MKKRGLILDRVRNYSIGQAGRKILFEELKEWAGGLSAEEMIEVFNRWNDMQNHDLDEIVQQLKEREK